jgi:FkbM family methyltransferase
VPLTSGLLKPCYVFAPQVLCRRIGQFLSGDKLARDTIKLPWGAVLEINGHEGIGRELARQNIFDIAVSEVAFRILKAGDRVVDVGANIGYMTTLFAMKAGPRGSVMAFEPHPRILERLRRNVARASSRPGTAMISVHDCALGSQEGVGRLVEPPIFELNEGAATIAPGNRVLSGGETTYDVQMMRLDSLVVDGGIALLKVDVEGFEPEVLGGAERLLSERRVQNIIYEAHDCERSPVHAQLAAYGYSIFGLGHTLFGLKVTAGTAAPKVDRAWESPSYLATSHPDSVIPLLGEGGWRVLKAVH